MFSSDKYTRVYFDTEFTGLYQDTKLISIGCITDTGDTFYAEFNDFLDHPHADDPFIQEVIISHLKHKEDTIIRPSISTPSHLPHRISMRGDTDTIREELLQWLQRVRYKHDPTKPIQFVSDCLAYDWVLLNNLICPDGCALNLPEGLHYIPIDICTMMEMKDIDPDTSREEIIRLTGTTFQTEKHNALFDAQMIRLWYHYLQTDVNHPTVEEQMTIPQQIDALVRKGILKETAPGTYRYIASGVEIQVSESNGSPVIEYTPETN